MNEEQISILKAAGASDEYLQNHQDFLDDVLFNAGASEEYMEKRNNVPKPSIIKQDEDIMNPIQDFWKENLGEEGEKTDWEKESPSFISKFLYGEKAQFIDELKDQFGNTPANAALQYYSKQKYGLPLNEKFVDDPEDLTVFERAFGTLGMIGDAPTYGVGGLIGGGLTRNPLKANLAGGILTKSVDKMYRDAVTSQKYDLSFKDWYQAFLDSWWDGTKMGLTGAAGVKAAAIPKSALAKYAAFNTALVTAGSALEGQIASFKDYATSFLFTSPFFGKKIYQESKDMFFNGAKNTTDTPQDFAKDITTDPLMKSEFASKNKTVFTRDAEANKKRAEELNKKYEEVDSKLKEKITKEEKTKLENKQRQLEKKLDQIGYKRPTETVELSQNEFKNIPQRDKPLMDKLKNLIVTGRYKKTKQELRDEKDPLSYDVVTQLADRMYPIKDFVNKTKKYDIKDELLYERARLDHIGKGDYFIEKGTLDFNTYTRNGESLIDALKPFEINKEKVSIQKFFKGGERYSLVNYYLVAKRHNELKAKNIDTNMPDDLMQEVIQKYDSPQFKEGAKRVVDYENRALKFAVDGGLLNKETYNSLIKEHQMYIPMMKDINPKAKTVDPQVGSVLKEIKGLEPLKKKRAKIEKNLVKAREENNQSKINQLEKQLKDTDTIIEKATRVLDPIETIYQNTHHLINMTERNSLTNDIINTVLEVRKQEPDFMPEVKQMQQTKKYALTDAELTKMGVDINMTPEQRQFIGTIYRKDGLFPSENSVVRYNKGKREIWEMPQDMVYAIKGMKKELSRSFRTMVKPLAMWAKVKRYVITVDPTFPVRNFLYGEWYAGAFAKDTIYYPFVDGTKGILKLGIKSLPLAKQTKMGKRYDELWDQYKISGAAMSNLVDIGRNYIRAGKMKKSLEQRPMYNVVTGNWLQRAQIVSEGTEYAPKFQTFTKVYKNLEKQNLKLPVEKRLTPKQIMQKAGFRARDVFDHQKEGANILIQTYNSMNEFNRAKITGMGKLIEGAKTNKKKLIGVGTLYVALPTLLLWSLNRDNETYQDLPQWKKDAYFNLYLNANTEDEVPIHFNKPFEFGAFWSNPLERWLNWIDNEDREFGNTLQQAIWEELWDYSEDLGYKIAIPSSFGRFLNDVRRNKDSFFKTPVVPQRVIGDVGERQVTPYTSNTSRILTTILTEATREMGFNNPKGFSPLILEYTIKNILPSIGPQVLKLTDILLEEAGVAERKFKKPLSDDFIDKLVDFPIVSMFLDRTATLDKKPVDDFWNTYNEIKPYLNVVEKFLDEGDNEKAEEYAGKLNTQIINETKEDIKVITDYLKSYRELLTYPKDGPLSPAELHEFMEREIYIIIEEAKFFNKQVLEIKKRYRENK